MYEHTLYSRDLDCAIREILADPAFTNYLTFDAERRYIARPDGTPMRVFSEFHHGDHMWYIQVSSFQFVVLMLTRMQDNLGPGSKPILLCAYADGTQISSHGNVSVWSVYIALANLPHHIRGSRGKGGYMLVGYIPKVCTFVETVALAHTAPRLTYLLDLKDPKLLTFETRCIKTVGVSFSLPSRRRHVSAMSIS